jgi:hypothetical protein
VWRRAKLSVTVAPITGRGRGTTIDLDVAPNQPFEGNRVHVMLELVDDDLRLTPEEQARAWSAWLKSGPDGSIAAGHRGRLRRSLCRGRSSNFRSVF